MSCAIAGAIASDAAAHSTFGDIRIGTTRLATATTLWGSIVASIGQPDWGRALEFSTMPGDIAVTIPAATNARVQATTQSGRITSDFPLTQGSSRDRRGTIGSGGPMLKLSTMNGDIALRRAGG